MKSALSAGTNKSGTKELRNQRNTEHKKRLFVNSWGKNNFQFQEVFFEQPAQEIACLAVLLFWHLSGVLLAICMIRFLK